MRKMEKWYWNGVCKMHEVKGKVGECARKRVKGGVEAYLAAGILCVVALFLGGVFKDELKPYFETFFGKMETESLKMF